ncbi:MAG TPA: alpha/beta fold hydrolase [Polyangiaceae bacterium]|nr:alpha/beta fold hydrolase [Polyangiaceae bacterium]
MLRPALLVLGSCVLLLLVIRTYGVRYVLFPTWALRSQPARPVLEKGEVWTLDTQQGSVEAFFFPAAARAPTVLFAHGNGELIDDNRSLAAWYQEHGFSVLMPEYRGYGRSQGTPSNDTLVADFVTFYDRLRAHPAVDAKRIYFHGRSLGGAVAAGAAAKRAPRALILESTFVSVRQLARERRVPAFLVAASFDTEVALRNVRMPVLLIHGRDDELVPAQHAQQLASRLPQHTLLLLDCAHNDCPLQEAAILRFLRAAP